MCCSKMLKDRDKIGKPSFHNSEFKYDNKNKKLLY